VRGFGFGAPVRRYQFSVGNGVVHRGINVEVGSLFSIQSTRAHLIRHYLLILLTQAQRVGSALHKR
jgi:hypothetical protein